MKKKRWFKKVLYLSCLLVTIVIMTSCSKKDKEMEKLKVDNHVDTEVLQNTNSVEEETSYNTEFGEDATLLPKAGSVRERNTYICYDVKSSVLKEYYDSLKKQGYHLLSEEIVGSYTYGYYTNGENCIQVVELEDSVFVSIARNYREMEKEEGGLSSEQAIKLIKHKDEVIDYEEQDGGEQRVTNQVDVIIKYWISDLYEKTNIIAYSAYSKEGKNAGTYLIYNNMVYQINDLGETCVADLDQNGTYELLSLYGFGFGTYRISLNVYQSENPIYFSSLNKVIVLSYNNCFVPEQSFGNLRFKKESDTKVHLIEIEEDSMQGQTKEVQVKDYGKLIIAEDGIHIIPEHMEQFPYYQWDYDYKRPDSEIVTEKILEEIPKLKVSIGDTKLNYAGSKIDWNGEKEEAVEFSALMDDKVPIFDYPNIAMSYTEDICLKFDDTKPTKIIIQDYLLTEGGGQMYSSAEVIERDVRYGDDGNYYIDLVQHFALFLSSNSTTYTNPSYRGFRVTCEFGDNQICEYAFVLSVAPQMEEY